jgi:hypothetical protein
MEAQDSIPQLYILILRSSLARGLSRKALAAVAPNVKLHGTSPWPLATVAPNVKLHGTL